MLKLEGVAVKIDQGGKKEKKRKKKTSALISEDHFNVLKVKLKLCPARVSISAR